MKSFKEYTKDTIFTYEWSEFCNWPESIDESWEYIQEGPNLFNKTITNMKKGSIRDVAKSLQKKAKQQMKSVGRNDVLLYNKKEQDLMILTKKALERDLQSPDEWMIIER